MALFPTPQDLDAMAARRGRLAVLAVPGAALAGRDIGTSRDTVRAASRVARAVVVLVREGYRVLVVHGSQPQLDRELLRSEESATKAPPRPLDACVASTQGTVGYRLNQAVRNALRGAGLKRPVTATLTQVLVSPEDPALQAADAAIGPVYSAWRAREVSRGHGWHMVEQAGLGWRQVVPRPRPVDVLDVDGVELLLDAGHVVLAGGGGGVPVAVNGKGELNGVRAVIDAELTAGLFASLLGAHLMVFLTDLEHLYVNFGGTEQRALEHLDREQLRSHHSAGQFRDDARVEAALEFLDEGGQAVVLTSHARLAAALNDRAGTRVSRDAGPATVTKQLGLFGQAASEDPSTPAEAGPEEP